MRKSLFFCCLVAALAAQGATSSRRQQESVPDEQRTGTAVKATADTFDRSIARTKPRFTGAFTVGIVFVDFPDTVPVDAAACMKRQTEGVEAYFKRYTQDVCWPVFQQLGSVYRAPKPLGYYARYDALLNRIGWKSEAEGKSRVSQLRNAAFGGGSSGRRQKVDVEVLACSWPTTELAVLDKISEIRSLYQKEVKQSEEELAARGYREYPDQLTFYNPAATIRWGDPLWPNSSLMLNAQGGAGTMIHELGHVLGAPDTYHAPEINDGVPGNPVNVGGGPTAPLYARYRYCGLLDAMAYPMVRQSTTLRLAPRWSRFDGATPLGIFIPTSHPNYLLHLEYEPSAPQTLSGGSEDEVGRYSDTPSANGGIYIYYINVTRGDPYHGTPDLVYSYRHDDPWFRGDGKGQIAVFREGSEFTAESDPANLLPNRLPTGISFTFGPQDANGAEVTIQVPKKRLSGAELKQSLLPIVELERVDELQPTSFRAKLNVQFRGEPLLTERGFCWGPGPQPTVRNAAWPLWGFRGFDGDEARVPNLRPGSALYVRAYAKSPLGIVYSKKVEKIVLPKSVDEVPALLLDDIRADSEQIGQGMDRQYKSGVNLNATPFVALLKLMAHFHAPLDNPKPSAKRAYSLAHLHLAPTLQRFPPTVADLLAARDDARTLAEQAGLMETAIPQDLAKRVLKAFKLKPATRKGADPVVPVDFGNLSDHLPRIRASLLAGMPVLCLRVSNLVSHPQYAPDVCILDGFRNSEEGEFQLHIVYPGKIDRLPKTNRKTGWHPPEALLDGVEDARLLFLPAPGASPLQR